MIAFADFFFFKVKLNRLHIVWESVVILIFVSLYVFFFFLLSWRFDIYLIFFSWSFSYSFFSCLVFLELSGSLDFCLSLILENSWPSSFQIYLRHLNSFLSSPRAPMTCTLDSYCPIILECPVVFYSLLFFLCFILNNFCWCLQFILSFFYGV